MLTEGDSLKSHIYIPTDVFDDLFYACTFFTGIYLGQKVWLHDMHFHFLELQFFWFGFLIYF